MKSELVKILNIEAIDLRIIELENSKELFPKQVEELENALTAARNAIQETETEMKRLHDEIRKFQEQVVLANEALEKSQTRLNTIKTNKEYDAVYAEIEGQKHIVASNEKHIQRHQQQLEDLEKKLQEQKENLDTLTEESTPQIEDLKTKIASIDSSVADARSERETIIPSITKKQFVRAYEHIRNSRKKGHVCSIVTGANRVCTICYQMLQPQVINAIRKADSVTYCQSCGSILIWEGNIKETVKE